MHAAAAQTAAASGPLILAAAACMIRLGGSPSLSHNSRRVQYMTPIPSGLCIREEHCRRHFSSCLWWREAPWKSIPTLNRPSSSIGSYLI